MNMSQINKELQVKIVRDVKPGDIYHFKSFGNFNEIDIEIYSKVIGRGGVYFRGKQVNEENSTYTFMVDKLELLSKGKLIKEGDGEFQKDAVEKKSSWTAHHSWSDWQR